MAVPEKKLRLNIIARQLKVGQSTIVDFLEKKGIKIENSPSTIIEPPVYEIINKEFGGKSVEGINIHGNLWVIRGHLCSKILRDVYVSEWRFSSSLSSSLMTHCRFA